MALQPSGLLYPPLLYFTISRRTFLPPNVQARSVFRLSCPLRFPKLCLRFHNWFPFRCWIVSFNPLCKGPFFSSTLSPDHIFHRSWTRSRCSGFTNLEVRVKIWQERLSGYASWKPRCVLRIHCPFRTPIYITIYL